MFFYKRLLPLFAAALLSGCGAAASPARDAAQPAAWNEQALMDTCAAALEAIRASDFDALYAKAASLEQSLPPQKLSEQWAALSASARAYSGTQTMETKTTESGAQVQVTSIHARYNILSTFSFSDSGTITALSMRLAPLTVAPASGRMWEEFPITLGYDPQKQLNGMLTLPRNVEKPPVAILVAGSGPQGMDSLIGAANNRPMADLAQGLAEHGIASIRYDKRSYAYPEDVVDIQTEYLFDFKDAVRFALEDPRVDGGRLYLIGHSQGGMLSPKLAQDNPQVRGVVSLGGTLRRIEDLILEQTVTRLSQDTTQTDEQKNAQIAKTQAELQRVRGLTEDSAADRMQILLGYPASYWISLNAIDQAAIARDLALPMLIMQGDNDFQVLYEKDFTFWQQVLAGREDVTFRHYAGLSHVFMPGSRDRFDSSSYDPPAKMDRQVISDIAGWILSQP